MGVHEHSGGRGYGQGGGGVTGTRRGMPLSDLDPALTAVSHTVIGCARDVHMALGPGFPREVYLAALCQEMTSRGVEHRAGAVFSVKYKDQPVGELRADLLIAGRFVLTVLAQDAQVSTLQRMQQRAILKAGDLELGLIINFAGKLLKDGLVRVINPEKLGLTRGGADADPQEHA